MCLILVPFLLTFLVLFALLNYKKIKSKNINKLKIGFFHPFWYKIYYLATMEEEGKKCCGA